MSGILADDLLGDFEVAPLAAGFDLLAADQPSVSDAVFLIEATATDGSLIVTPGVDILADGMLADGEGVVTGGTVALDWSDADWTSSPTDDRSNIHFEGRAGEITIDRALPLRADGARRVAVALSGVDIINADGAWDAASRALAVDGQPVAISILQSRASAYSTRKTVFSGIGLDWRADARTLRLRARDLTYILDVPMLGTYGGAGGADGGDDLKGKVIPEVWGVVRNMAPVALADGGLQSYQIHARQVRAITGVYVRGAVITAGTEHANYAALAGATVAGGAYDWCSTAAGTYIRLGSAVDGTVTVDVQGDASTTYSAAIGGMMRRILSRAGASLSTPGFDNIEAIAPGAAGIVFADQVTFADALNRLAGGGFFWWGDDGAGVITAGRTAPPFGEGSAALDETVIVDDVERMDDPGIAWRVTAGYRRNWSPISGTDIASGLTDARRLELSEARRIVAVSDAARLSRNAQAEDVTIETLFDAEADASGIASNVINLMRSGLNMWRVPCNAIGLAFVLGQQARLTWPRFGLSAGLDVRVIGQAIRGRRVDLLVIG